MEPFWYINKSTGLIVLENGGIVEWNVFKVSVAKERLDSYMVFCRGSRKRRPSLDAAEYHDYTCILARNHVENSMCECDDCA